MPVKTWATNDVPTASDLNTQFRDQVISTVTSGTRPAGIEGQHIVETDTDLEYIYSGSGWVNWGGYGAWTSYTPTITQSTTVTKTITYAKYFKVGRYVTVNVVLAVTGTGSANSPVNVTVPFTAATSSLDVGVGHIVDTSAGLQYPQIVNLGSTTAIQFFDSTQAFNVATGQTGAAFSAALAAGDTIVFSASYESAS